MTQQPTKEPGREGLEVSEEQLKEREMTARIQDIGGAGEFVVGGETRISDEVLAAIAGVAADEVDGVSSLGESSIRRSVAEAVGAAEERSRGVQIEAGKKEAIIDLVVNVTYGFSIPELVVKVRKHVAKRLVEYAGLVAKEINVRIGKMDFPERMPGTVQ